MSNRTHHPRRAVFHAREKKRQKRVQEFQDQWRRLNALCPDQESQLRLTGLREQFERHRRGVSEPAQVEVEIASFMIKAGFSVAFLQESESRTADLECWLGTNRVFVEITAIVPNPSPKLTGNPRPLPDTEEQFLEGDIRQEAFVRRLLARMAEKSRQLSRYCAPVLLAVTVPNDEFVEGEEFIQEELDLQRLAGIMSTALAGIPQLSGVLLTCWNIPAKPTRSNVRLSQAHWVTRSGSDVTLPRIRLLVINAFAAYALDDKEAQALKSIL